MQRTLFAVVALVAVVLAAVLFFVLKPKPAQTVASSSTTDPVAGARFIFGPADAKVTVVEFANYLCVHCRDHSSDVLPQIKAQYIDTGKIRYIFRDLPFQGQEMVVRAGEAAACAADSKLYFEYQEVLFRSGSSWANLTGDALDSFLSDLASQIGMAPATFSSCLKSGSKRAGVLADQDAATKLGVSGTPTFYVNGVQYTGARSFDSWKDILDKGLAGSASSQKSSSGQSTPNKP